MKNLYSFIRRVSFLTLAVLIVASVAAAREPQDKKAEKPKTPGWLGVMIQDVTKSLAKQENLKAESGAYVNDVVDESPAETAGLKEGDVIIAFAGKEVSDAETLTKAVQSTSPGTKTSVTVLRDGEKKDLPLTVGQTRIPRGFAFNVPTAPTPPKQMVRVFLGEATLGMEVRTLNEQLAAYFGAPNEEGVLVESVEENSLAEKAGFKAGDVIFRVGKKSIDEVDEIHRALRKYKEGDKVEFEVIRRGDRKILTFTKEAAPEPGEDHLFRLQRYFDGRKVLEYSTPDPGMKELHLKIEQLNGDLHERMEEMPKVIKKTIRTNAGSDV